MRTRETGPWLSSRLREISYHNMKKTKKNKKGYIFNGPDFSVAIKYSDKAIKNDIIKFIPKDGRPFELLTNDFVELLAKHVNFQTLAPAMIHNKMIKMVQVTRNITLRVNRDIKEGEVIQIPFTHMHPIEFAIAEAALGVANMSERVQILNRKHIVEAAKHVDESINEFAHEQWDNMIKKMREQETENSQTSP